MNKVANVCLVVDQKLPKCIHEELSSLIDSRYNISLVLIERSSSIEAEKPSYEQKSSFFETIKSAIRNWLSKESKIWRVLSGYRHIASRIKKGEFGVLIGVERKIASYLKPETSFVEKWNRLTQYVDVIEENKEISKSEVTWFKPKQVGDVTYDFPEWVLEKIEESCDVVILLGFNKILKGDILSAAPHGVLSLHGGDIRKYRGRPGQFFQWINDEKKVGYTLQRLNESLDGGELIACKHVNISDAKSWREVQCRLVSSYGDLVVKSLDQINSPEFEPEVPELGSLTYAEEGHKFANVFSCLKRNLKKRYF